MKKTILLFVLLIAAQLIAQEKSTLTVKNTETSNGVVIVVGQNTAARLGAALTEPTSRAVELQCNKGASGCTPLKAGSYTLIKLPPNRGMYDCADVLVYAAGVDPDKGDRIGEYCLTEK